MGKGDGKEEEDDGKGKGNVEILSKRYNSDDTDVKLVSSDGITFKVHSYRLRCFSSVLGSMFSLAQNDAQRDPIILTDSVIENSAVIRHLLDIIHDLEVESFADVDTCRYAIDLADKWDMSDVRKIIRQTLRGIFYEDSKIAENPFAAFVIATRLQDYKVASSIIKHFDTVWVGKAGDAIKPSDPAKRIQSQVWECGELRSKLDYHSTAEKDIFDIQYCGYRDALRLPPTVVWVLLRAATKSRVEKGCFDRTIVAETFLKLMTEAYPESAEEQGKQPNSTGVTKE